VHVCVFCASASRIDAAFVDAARAVGTWIGARGHALVWGGCNVGLMNEVGQAARAAGARTIAVIPGFMVERGLAFEPCTERVVTRDLADRKAEFRRRADAYVALPGGVGTWEEVLEVLALRKLARLSAPIVLVNVDGYYDPLLAMLQRSVEAGFSPPDLLRLLAVAADAPAAVNILESSAPPPAGLDLGPGA
jgi:uncharacterized protein (TIGR00730 family)